MSAESYSWLITRQRESFPLNHPVYRASRAEVPAEIPLPEIGDSASSLLGTAWNDHYILNAGDKPQGGKKNQWFTFAAVPANFTDYETMGYVFPAVYPTDGLADFAGGSLPRPRTVPTEVLYEFAHGDTPPTVWLTAAVHATDATSGPLQVKSYISQAADTQYDGTDGRSYRIGRWLATMFLTQDTINDQITLSSLRPPHDDIAYGVPASAPNATTYQQWVTNKTQFIADRTIRRWAGKIWMRRTRKITAQ